MNEPNSLPLPMQGLQRENSGDRFVLGMLSPDVGGGKFEPVDNIVMPMKNLNLRKINDGEMTTTGTAIGTAPCTTNSCAASSILEDLNREAYDWKGFLKDPIGTRSVKKPIRKPSEAARLFLQNDEVSQSSDSRRRNRKKSEAATLLLHNNYEGGNDHNFMTSIIDASQNEVAGREIPPNAFHFEKKCDIDESIDLSCAINGSTVQSDQFGTRSNKAHCRSQKHRFIKSAKMKCHEGSRQGRKRCKHTATKPNDSDVLCGRGGLTNHHPGNIRFREFVAEEKSRYVGLGNSKKEKTYFSEHILRTVHNYGGRFLKKDKAGKWFVVDNDVARTKCSQALREK